MLVWQIKQISVWRDVLYFRVYLEWELFAVERPVIEKRGLIECGYFYEENGNLYKQNCG